MDRDELIKMIEVELNGNKVVPTSFLLNCILDHLKQDKYIVSFMYQEKDEDGYGCLQYEGKIESLDQLINNIKMSEQLHDVIILNIFKI